MISYTGLMMRFFFSEVSKVSTFRETDLNNSVFLIPMDAYNVILLKSLMTKTH